MFNNTKHPNHCISELLQSNNKNADYIVTLHGLRRSLKHMKSISNALYKDMVLRQSLEDIINDTNIDVKVGDGNER